MQALQQDDEWVGPTPGADSDSAPYTTDSPERGVQASRRFIDDEARDGEGSASDDDTNGDDLDGFITDAGETSQSVASEDEGIDPNNILSYSRRQESHASGREPTSRSSS
jgi:hypothetical protein